MDLPVINEILHISKQHWGYDEAFMNTYMRRFSVSKLYMSLVDIYLMSIDEIASGFFSFRKKEDTNNYELEFFFLHPDYIGQGYGRKLWLMCLETAQELGIHEFKIIADPNVKDFYSKMGCEVIDTISSPMGHQRILPIFRYRL